VLESLKNRVGEWLRGGPEGDVVISSRVRLARNIAGHAFLTRSDEQEIARIEELLRDKITSCEFGGELTYCRLDQIDPLLGQLLVERHLIAKDHAAASWVRGVAFCPRERLSMMVNEEDHLRIQLIGGGLRLEEAWREVDRVDDILGDAIPFAFSARYGYLTACPSNLGTGMRASVMVHLPALVMAREMEKVIELAQCQNLAVRGLYGEGTHASADLYQISNQVSLGVSEGDILAEVNQAASQVLELERGARENLLGRHRAELQGRIERALEMLRSTVSVSSEEALHLLSQVRLGVQMGLLKGVAMETLNELLLLTLPAHLQTMEGKVLESLQRDEVRAGYVRERLSAN
jgi:protein arginine kinase